MGFLSTFFLIGIIFIRIFWGPLIVIDRGMVCVYTIKLNVQLALGAPPPFYYISSELILGILDVPRLNIIQTLNVTLVWVLYFTIIITTYC